MSLHKSKLTSSSKKHTEESYQACSSCTFYAFTALLPIQPLCHTGWVGGETQLGKMPCFSQE